MVCAWRRQWGASGGLSGDSLKRLSPKSGDSLFRTFIDYLFVSCTINPKKLLSHIQVVVVCEEASAQLPQRLGEVPTD